MQSGFSPKKAYVLLRKKTKLFYVVYQSMCTPSMSSERCFWWDKRQWVQTETQEVLSEHFFTVRVTKHCTGCPGGWWSPHPWRYSKAAWTWTWATGSSCPCLRNWVRPGDLQRSLPTSAILWFCFYYFGGRSCARNVPGENLAYIPRSLNFMQRM